MTPLDCNTCQDALADCLDAESQPSAEVAQHLAECAACAADWSNLQQAWRALRPEGLTLSAAAQERVRAYAVAHAPPIPGAEPVIERKPLGRWFWGAFAVALALVVWKFGPVSEPQNPAAPASEPVVAEAMLAPMPEPTPVAAGSAQQVAVAQAEATGSGAVAAVLPAPQLRAEAPQPRAVAPDRSATRAKEEIAMVAPSAPAAPREAEKARSRVRSEAMAESDVVAQAAEEASSPARAATGGAELLGAAPAPAAKAAVREGRAAASAPSLEAATSDRAAVAANVSPGLDAGTRAALAGLAAQATASGPGWARLRAVSAAPSLAAFESILAGCGNDTLLCDGAALGAGAMRAAVRRADATPLLQRAARSSSGAVAAAARRILTGP